MPLGAALHRGRPHRTAFCTMVSLVSITRQVDGHNEARHVRSASDSLSYDPARRHPPPPDVTHSPDDPDRMGQVTATAWILLAITVELVYMKAK
jgi:hypothetical protein